MFKDRFDAGKQLAEKLIKYKGRKGTIVFGIPRGGVEIGFEISRKLKLPLEPIITKKIGFPGNEEYAIGAVGPGKEYILDDDAIKGSGISRDYINEEIESLNRLIEERYKAYKIKKLPNARNKNIILADDGIATGNTMKLSIQLLRKQKPKKIILAVPVAPKDSIKMLKSHADELICLDTPLAFFAIGQFYENFAQVSDEQVIEYLEKGKDYRKV
ncbi:phosphoribosyltransferase [Candidatus Woesearchaeota archaeon]|nr:phosphoribosyltransferase [Candidatus Woesearchaeota archaeon]